MPRPPPDIDGMQICKTLRRDKTTAKIPIIMLTAKAADVDRALGLKLGADAYVTKPFSPRELVLSVRKILQRDSHPELASDSLTFGELLIGASPEQSPANY